MDSKQYIETLKKKSKEPVPVAMREALVFYLHNQNISFSIIAKCMQCTRRLTYYQYYQARDLLEANDSIMKTAYNEIKEHYISIKPYTIDGNIFTQFAGYRLIIDNIIY